MPDAVGVATWLGLDVTAPRVTTIGYFTTGGTATYHALQLSFNRRFGKGLSLTSGYNFGNSKDNVTGLGTSTGGYGNFIGPFAGAIENVKKYDWATSDFNIRHRFSFGANYELPSANHSQAQRARRSAVGKPMAA